MNQVEKIEALSELIEGLNSDSFTKFVEEHISDEAINAMSDHIDDFYGIDTDEELGMLTQIMVTGYLMGLNEKATLTSN